MYYIYEFLCHRYRYTLQLLNKKVRYALIIYLFSKVLK